MTKGKPVKFTVEEVKEILYEKLGNVTATADFLGCSRAKLYDYVDEHDLRDYVERCQEKEGLIMDDMSMTALEKLIEKLSDEPSVAMKAALATLQRRGSSRRQWAKDSTDTNEQVATLKKLLQNKIGPPEHPKE